MSTFAKSGHELSKAKYDVPRNAPITKKKDPPYVEKNAPVKKGAPVNIQARALRTRRMKAA